MTATSRLTVTAIDKPQPATEVIAVDLISCKSDSAPCILAMTAVMSGLVKLKTARFNPN